MRRAALLVSCLALVVAAATLGRASDVTGTAYVSSTGECVEGVASVTPRTDGMVAVPKVSGLPFEDAFQRLHAAGLRVATDGPIRLGPTTGLPPAWKQRPRPGTQVQAGSAVLLIRGWGHGGLILPTFEEVTAPNVAGMSLGEAIARLEGSGVVWHASVPRLRGLYAESLLDAYCVDRQTPAAGTRFMQTIARQDANGIHYRWTKLKLHVVLR